MSHRKIVHLCCLCWLVCRYSVLHLVLEMDRIDWLVEPVFVSLEEHLLDSFDTLVKLQTVCDYFRLKRRQIQWIGEGKFAVVTMVIWSRFVMLVISSFGNYLHGTEDIFSKMVSCQSCPFLQDKVDNFVFMVTWGFLRKGTIPLFSPFFPSIIPNVLNDLLDC